MRSHSLMAGIVAMAVFSVNAFADDKKETPKALSFTMKNIDGENVDLASKYSGKVILFVNVASYCGNTKQYTGLEKLHESYAEKGLAVVGVPCNQFGAQEPDNNKAIKEFCKSKYKVAFDLLDKSNVNDDSGKSVEACPLYKYLTSVETKPLGKGKVAWNFEKFLVDRKGNVVARFGNKVDPESKEVVEAIEAALKAE